LQLRNEDVKRHIYKLAILGGRPVFGRPLHVGRPNVEDWEGIAAKAAFETCGQNLRLFLGFGFGVL